MIIANMKRSFVGEVYNLEDDMYKNYEALDCNLNVKVNNAFLGYRSEYDKDHPCKPYLKLIGTCDNIEGEFPYNINKINFNDRYFDTSIIYEFDNDELSELVKKGLYQKDFKVPKEILRSELNVDGKVDILCVKPDEDKIPLMFADVVNKNELYADKEMLGDIDFVSLFEKAKSLEVSKDVVEEENILDVSSEIKPKDNIFENEEYFDFTEEENELIDDIDKEISEAFNKEDINETTDLENLTDDAYDLLSDEDKRVLALKELYGDLDEDTLLKYDTITKAIKEKIESDYEYNNRSIEEILKQREEVSKKNVEDDKEIKEEKENVKEKEDTLRRNILDNHFEENESEDKEFE